MTPWLSIVGIGEDGLDGVAPSGRLLVEQAEILVGAARHLAMAPLSLESTLEMEAMAQSLGFHGPELAEGRAAFADKRKPNFR